MFSAFWKFVLCQLLACTNNNNSHDQFPSTCYLLPPENCFQAKDKSLLNNMFGCGHSFGKKNKIKISVGSNMVATSLSIPKEPTGRLIFSLNP